MIMKGPKNYLTFEEYRDAADSLYAVSGLILFSFAGHDSDVKNQIIRNFIARSSMMLKGIFKLWEISDYQDAWIIYRAMLDRLFHLHDLGVKNAFLEFEDWSFFEQYKAQNKIKSDPVFKGRAVGGVYELRDDQKSRFKSLSANPPKWRRPKAEDVAKSMSLDFLYKYGYDFASTLVHPMANDGHQDFHTITQLKPAPKFPDQISVLSNSVLISSLLLQEAMNLSSFRWRRILWDYIEQIGLFLDKGAKKYKESFLKVARLSSEVGLCERVT
jgi:hypothetical protein